MPGSWRQGSHHDMKTNAPLCPACGYHLDRTRTNKVYAWCPECGWHGLSSQVRSRPIPRTSIALCGVALWLLGIWVTYRAYSDGGAFGLPTTIWRTVYLLTSFITTICGSLVLCYYRCSRKDRGTQFIDVVPWIVLTGTFHCVYIVILVYMLSFRYRGF